MTQHAVVVDGEVVNVILWDGEKPYDSAGELIPLSETPTVSIGWQLEDDEWIAPPPPVPDEPDDSEEIEALQALRAAGIAKLIALGLTEQEALALAGT